MDPVSAVAACLQYVALGFVLAVTIAVASIAAAGVPAIASVPAITVAISGAA